MSFTVSPGVSVSEYDNTNTIPVQGTSVGGFAGDFTWGPAGKRITISSEGQLVSTFQQPNSNNYAAFFSAANFLAYTNNLLVVRSLNTNSNNAIANPTASGYSIANRDVWEINYSTNNTILNNIGGFAARYAGSIGNSLTIAVCSSNTAFKTPMLSANTVVTSNTVTISGFSGASFAATYPNFAANDNITINGTQYTIASISANTITTVSNQIATANSVGAKVSWQYASSFSAAPGTSVYGSAQGAVNDEISIAVIDTNGLFTGVKGYILETYDRLSKATDGTTDSGENSYYQTVILNKSNYIYNAGDMTGETNWDRLALNNTFSSAPNYSIQLTGGTDVISTDGDRIIAYSLFTNPNEVTIDL